MAAAERATAASPPRFARSHGVALAQVERRVEPGRRQRLLLSCVALGTDVGAIDASELWFLSVETLERLPLQAVLARQSHDTLWVEAEARGSTSSLELPGVLVVRRGQIEAPAGSLGVTDAGSGIDYLARDFEAFRSLILARVTSLTPSWTDRTPADIGVMLSDVLAYLADGLAYEQDAVATEAYLTTARHRVSVRRHTRLLGYWLGQGVGARVWVVFRATERVLIPRGTRLLAGPPGQAVLELGTAPYEQQRTRATAVFETMEALEVWPELVELAVWDQGQRNYSIAAGATEVDLVGEVSSPGGQSALEGISIGTVLLLAPTSPDVVPHPVRVTSLLPLGGGGGGQRALVRVGWAHADAPPIDLPVTRTEAGITRRHLTLVRGNVVLADFGETTQQPLPTRESLERPYEPLLPSSIVSLAGPPPGPATSAAACFPASDEQVCPAIELKEQLDLGYLAGVRPEPPIIGRTVPAWGPPWRPVPDLLLASPYSSVFVAEAREKDWLLRFGDGTFGRSVRLGASFLATFRVGDTVQSNIGQGAITAIVAPESKTWKHWTLAQLRVVNPLPAVGGRRDETLDHARQTATAQAHQSNAAVTLDDYATLARRVPGVADAVALQRWTGSWFTTFVHVRVDATAPLPGAVLREVREQLEAARLAGRTVIVREPEWVALYVALRVEVASGFNHEELRAALRGAFVGQSSAVGPASFFDPSRWSFGERVFGSAVVTWARGVPGVRATELKALRRAASSGHGQDGQDDIVLSGAELPLLRDDAFDPRGGTLELELISARTGQP